MTGIMLTGVVFKWEQRQAGHIAYWQQQRAVEQRKGEAASQLSDTLERHQAIDHAKGSMECIDGELSRLTGSQGQSVTTPQQPRRAHLDETRLGGSGEGRRRMVCHAARHGKEITRLCLQSNYAIGNLLGTRCSWGSKSSRKL
jgi:hypothetical protein